MTLLRQARLRSGLTLRALAEAAHTSHSTLAAYEHQRVAPTTTTEERVVRAAGWSVEPALVRALPERVARGEELAEVLALAAEFPARHATVLQAPVFGRA